MFGLISIAVFTYGVYLSCINGASHELEHYLRPEPLIMHSDNDNNNNNNNNNDNDHITIDIPADEQYTYEGNDQTGEQYTFDENLDILAEIESDSDVDEDPVINMDIPVIKQVNVVMIDKMDVDDESSSESLEDEEVMNNEANGTNNGVNNDEIIEIGDLWSSYQLEMKYDEMKNKKPLNNYLGLREWKMAVRRRFNEFINSHWFRSDPEKFISRERSKRNKDQYAVIDDTALNLVEYYHIKSSKEQ